MTAKRRGLGTTISNLAICEWRVDAIERWMEIHPAYDRTAKVPGEPNYGVHGMEWIWGVRRGQVAIVWQIMTPFQLPQVYDWWASRGLQSWDRDPYKGMGNLNYHVAVPQYEGQEPNSGSGADPCAYIGCACYSDGTAMTGELWTKLVAEGADAVWKELEQRLAEREVRVAEEIREAAKHS